MIINGMSPETYEITTWGKSKKWVPSNYPVGTLVHLIAGVAGNSTPGYHFFEGYVTICRVDAATPEYVGIKTKYLKRVKDPK